MTLPSSITGERSHYLQENINLEYSRGHQEEAHANCHDASNRMDNFYGDHIHVLDSIGD